MALGAAIGLLTCLVLAPTVSAAEPPPTTCRGPGRPDISKGALAKPPTAAYDITSMDMATGALSGTAETEGVSFALAGTESGSVPTSR